MAFTVRELAGRLDTTETTIRNAIAAEGVRPVGREVRLIQRMADVRKRPIPVYDLADVRRAIDARKPPPGVDQQGLARALGRHIQSIRNWTRQGMPCRRIGRFVRYDVDACREWLAARPKRQRRGRALNGGTVRHPLAVGLELGIRDQLRGRRQRPSPKCVRSHRRLVTKAAGDPHRRNPGSARRSRAPVR